MASPPSSQPDPAFALQDSAEDSDPFPLRKRPRLEDSSCIMSAEHALDPHGQTSQHPTRPSSAAHPEHTSTPSESTVRDTVAVPGANSTQQTSSQSAAAVCVSPKHDPVQSGEPSSLPSSPSSRKSLESSMALESAPDTAHATQSDIEYDVLAEDPIVELVEDDMEEVVDSRTDSILTLEDDDETDFLVTFPGADDEGSAIRAALLLAQHCRDATVLDYKLIQDLQRWLNRHLRLSQGDSETWPSLYLSVDALWKPLATTLVHLLHRKMIFSTTWTANRVDTLLTNLFTDFAILFSRLLLIDIDTLSPSPSNASDTPALLSHCFLVAFNQLFRPREQDVESWRASMYSVKDPSSSKEAPVWSTLPTQAALFQTAQAFEKPAVEGTHKLAQLVSRLLQYMYAHTTLRDPLVQCLCNVQHLMSLRLIGGHNAVIRGLLDLNSWPLATPHGYRVFDEVSAVLCASSPNLDVELVKFLVPYAQYIPSILAHLDSHVAKSLFAKIIGPSEMPESFDKGILQITWLLKTLKRFIIHGRMDVRLASVGIMHQELISLWNRYGQDSSSAILHHVAQTLMDEEILDYLISTDSHPQLVSRSANIVSFLAVTNTYTTAHTDQIWDAVVYNQDQWMAEAAMTMLRNVLQHLDLPNLIHLCQKINELALERFTNVMFDLIKEVQIWAFAKFDQEPPDTETVMIVALVAVRLVHESIDLFRKFHDNIGDLALEAVEDAFRRMKRPEDRFAFLEDCVKSLDAQNVAADGSVQIMLRVSSSGGWDENSNHAVDIINTPSIATRYACHLAQNQEVLYPSDPGLFHWRMGSVLQLLYNFMKRPNAFPAELDDTVWDQFVGHKAPNDYIRNIGWECFHHVVEKFNEESDRRAPSTRGCLNPFIERALKQQIPRLSPESFVEHSFHFLNAAVLYQDKFHSQPCTPQSDFVDVALQDILWRCILTVPEGSIEDNTIELLILQYLNRASEVEPSTQRVLERTHIALAQKCIEQLKDAYVTLEASDRIGEAIMPINAETSDKVRLADYCFRRTLRLLTSMLPRIRNIKMLSPTPATTTLGRQLEKDASAEEELLHMKYQIFDGNQHSEVGILKVCGQDSLADLRRNLSDVTGFAFYKLICGGQFIDLEKDCDMTIRKSGITSRGLVMIVRRTNGQFSQSSRTATIGGSAFERELLGHFNDLYEFMDSNDKYSLAIFDFLRLFKPQGKALTLIASDSTTVDELFPPGKLSKIQYSLQSLRLHISEKTSQDFGSLDFKLQSVRLLNEALLKGTLVDHPLEKAHEWNLVFDSVACFCDFLQALPTDSTQEIVFSDASTLIDRLFDTLQKSETRKAPKDFDPSVLTTRTFHLILRSAVHCPAAWSAFCNRSNFIEVHKALLVMHEKHAVRQSLAVMISSLMVMNLKHLTKSVAAAAYLPVLEHLVPEATQCRDTASQFFDTALKILHNNCESGALTSDALLSYFSEWTALLLSMCGQPATELRIMPRGQFVTDESPRADQLMPHQGLLGLTKLLNSSVHLLGHQGIPSDFGAVAQEILSDLLFPSSTEMDDDLNEEKIKHIVTRIPVLDEQTRYELQKLVLSLTMDVNVLQNIIRMTIDTLDQGYLAEDCSFHTDRSSHLRSPTGYVGIYNLSNTCYMNSLLSQLFMNVGFRRFILSATVTSDKNQSLLANAQKLFANMQDSYAKAAASRDFASAMTDEHGNPIDITVQMDVDEFFNKLFDKFESQLVSNEERTEFRKFYTGTYVTQIRPTDCEHVSEKAENFNALQLEVRGKKSLEESLKDYVKGDNMTGQNKYKCTQCNGGRYSNHAVKRTCLKDIPDSLILHLKRFDFDLESLARCKVNDQFKFPVRIDMEPYTLDHLTNPDAPKKTNEFELVGVLVHDGTAEVGHYYSHIRERPTPTKQAEKWLKFNDAVVTNFDMGKLDSACFGGHTPENQGEKAFSAYMLFYERSSKLNTAASQIESRAQSTLPPKVPVPRSISSEIASANQYHLLRYCLFDPAFPTFIHGVIDHVQTMTGEKRTKDLELESSLIELVFKTFDRVFNRIKDPPKIFRTMELFFNWILGHPILACKVLHFLGENADIAINLFVRGQSKNRSNFLKFLTPIIDKAREEEAFYGVDSSKDSGNTGFTFNENAAFPKFVRGIKNQLSHLAAVDRHWEDYFKLIIRLMEFGDMEAKMLLVSGFLEDCLGILLCDMDNDLSVKFGGACRLIKRTGRRLPPFKQLSCLLFRLLRFVDLNLNPVDNDLMRLESLHPSSGRFRVTDTEWNLLTHFPRGAGLAFFRRIVEYVPWGCESGTPDIPRCITDLVIRNMDPKVGLFSALRSTLRIVSQPSHASFLHQYLSAISTFCRVCPQSQRHAAEDMILNTTQHVRLPGSITGYDYLSFIQKLARVILEPVDSTSQQASDQDQTDDLEQTDSDLANIDYSQGAYYTTLVRTSPHWSHALLSCGSDGSARNETADLLDAFLFRYSPPMGEASNAPTSSVQGNDSTAQSASGGEGSGTQDTAPVRAKPIDSARAYAIRCLMALSLLSCHQGRADGVNKRVFMPMLDVLENCEAWLWKLHHLKGSEVEDLKSQSGVEVGDQLFTDDDLIEWWRTFAPLARDEWIDEEIYEASDSDPVEEEDPELAFDEP